MKYGKAFVKSHPRLRALAVPVAAALRRIHPPPHVLLERSFRELFEAVEAGSLVVKVPDFHGTFEIQCHSDILKRIMVYGHYEPDLAATVKRVTDRGKDAIDVGANIGLFSVLISSLLPENNRVLAIEPTPGALNYLRGNLARNKCGRNVIVFEGAATRTSGDFTINVVTGMEE